ncbi:MAG: PD40 domain-containing protein [Chloroflexi bacterium]|nr:PD40 domain-containing protein [Chloroflexota bacterium]
MTSRPQRRPPVPRRVGGDAAGPGRPSMGIAPLLAVVGLVVAAVLSLGLLSLSGSASAAPGTTPGPGATRTPTGPGPGQPTPNPSMVITPAPEQRAQVRGTMLFVRTGNIWSISGDKLTQLSDKGTDSWPAWAPDGARIYFTETRTVVAQSPWQGRDSKYTLIYPVIMSMAADGSDREEVQSGLYNLGGGANRRYFQQLLQADVSPDGKQFALVSDAPDPLTRDVTLSLMSTAGGKVTNLGVKDVSVLGHNDPDWSPDGKQIAFSYNGRNGTVGAPRVGIYTLATKKVRYVGPRGFANPSWSPDGKYVVGERTNGKGRDLAIVEVASGQEVNQLTRDGNSFSPVYSPDGTQIAYLRLNGQAIDLRIMTLEDDGSLKPALDKAITEDGSIDASSSPAWFFPPDLRPALPSPAASSARTESPVATTP